MEDTQAKEFEVWPMQREVTRNMCRPRTQEETDQGLAGLVMTQETAKEDGFMVFFPRGHSNFYTKTGLRMAGLDRPAMMVNLEDGERNGLAPAGMHTLRAKSLAKNGKSKSGGTELAIADLINSSITSVGEHVAEAMEEESA